MSHRRSTLLSRLAFTSLAMGALAACSGVVAHRGIAYHDTEARRDFLTGAAGHSAVLVQAANSPFQEGDRETAAVTARLSEGKGFGINVKYTDDPVEAAQPHFRIVYVFDTTFTTTAYDICSADAKRVKLRGDGSKLNVQAVFCAREEPIAEARVSAPIPSGGLADPAYETIVGAAIEELFPADDFDRDKEGVFRIQ